MKNTPLDTTRSEQIGVRLNGEERRLIEAAAILDNRKAADWVRLLAVQAARRKVRRNRAA